MSFPRYPKYKPSGVEWLGDVPEHWEVVSLKRRMQLLTEKTERRENPLGLENIEGWTGRFIPTATEFEGDGVVFECGTFSLESFVPISRRFSWRMGG